MARLRQQDGNARTPWGQLQDDAWVAVVKTPRSGLRKGKLIVALGETLVEATEAASAQWNELFSALEVH